MMNSPLSIRVLFSGGDRDATSAIADAVSHEEISVLYASTADEGLRLLREEHPDLVLVQLRPPKRAGFEVLRAIRLLGETPVIVLTADVDETERIVALELGADDCVSDSINPRELIARIGAVLRRSRCECGKVRGIREERFSTALEIDVAGSAARRNGRRLLLTPTEFRILEGLARHAGQTMTRAQILEYVASDADVFDRTLDKHIANLRKKIEEDPAHPRHVITVFGIGYKYAH